MIKKVASAGLIVVLATITCGSCKEPLMEVTLATARGTALTLRDVS